MGFFQAIIVNFLPIGIHGTDIMHPLHEHHNRIHESPNTNQLFIDVRFFFRTVRPKMGINIMG